LQPPYSRGARTPSPRNRGRAILSAGGVCLGSALHWWLGLLGVFPVCNPEPGSFFGLISGDPDPVTRSRTAWFPLATLTCDQSQPAPPHTALFDRGRTARQTGQWPWQECLRAEGYQADKSPRCADHEALRKPPGTAEIQAESGVLPGPPSWLGGGSLRPKHATLPFSRSDSHFAGNYS
jgi:hypothetical protein